MPFPGAYNDGMDRNIIAALNLASLEKGWVWLVGAGPGDPGLITALGLKAISEADFILYDALVDERLLALARPGAGLIFAGKRAGVVSCKQADISNMLIDLARKGSRVLRLKGGDPFVFGRGGEEVALSFHLAGHVAGAVGCLIEHRRQRHFFTGDVHFQAQRTVAGANFPRQPVDTLVMECTRGATTTVPSINRAGEERRLIKAINEICDEGGSVLLPAFAFGRMQEILMLLQEAADAGNLADVPIFCSGLGMDLCDYLDAASKKTKQVKFSRQVLRDLGIQPLSRKYTQPGKNMPERGIYLLSSGMLVEKTPAWRVAANMLDHAENAVFFVGYCDPETPGGELIGMAPGGEFKFKSLDHISTLRAKVDRFHLSGHADREELIDFAKSVSPKDIVLTHGDPPARAWMKETLASAMPGTRVHDPEPGVPIEL